jgi:hypothetical protein
MKPMKRTTLYTSAGDRRMIAKLAKHISRENPEVRVTTSYVLRSALSACMNAWGLEK